MLHVERFVCNPLQENCYVCSDDTKDCIIVDCGAFREEERNAITRYIDANGLCPRHLIATHAHIDHNLGNNTILEKYNLHPELPLQDKPLAATFDRQANLFLGVALNKPLPTAGAWLTEKDTVSFGHHTFTIIATPGHTPGSVLYYCAEEQVAFSGDTIFQGNIGRTDLPGGSMFQMIQSLRRIAMLPDDTVLLPGHGPQTTIGEELRTNPYMDR